LRMRSWTRQVAMWPPVVATDDHTRSVSSRSEQAAVDRERIIDAVRKLILGRKPVVR